MNTAVATKPNPFAGPASRAAGGSLVSVEQQRAIAEVQAAMLVARSMPRDPVEAVDLILQDCTDITLAEEAEYQYSRGGTDISGPSIRLMEAVARRWGNLECGVKELSRHDGVSECVAFAVDLQSGFRDSKTFQVTHWRDTKKGGYAVTDERDIYELVANMGARRKRACLEAIIPPMIVSRAQTACALALKAKVEITPDFIKTMLERFAAFNITKEMVEKKIQRHVDNLTPGLAVTLRRIYASLKDGMSAPSDWFEFPEGEPAETQKPAAGATGLKAAVKKSAKKDAAKTDAPSGATSTDASTQQQGGGQSAAATTERQQPATAETKSPSASASASSAGGAEKIPVDHVKLLTAIQNCTDLDVLDEHADLIGEIDDQDRRNTLTVAYKKRRGELTS